MPQLEKAKLEPVRADRNNSSAGDEVEVQFNPSSLRLTLTNQTEGGRSRGRQRRQHTGNSSTVLAMQLVFDSADETTGDESNPQAVSVRRKTAMVEQFVLPKEDGSETPPLLKFSWNELVVVGIVERVNIEFDLFASDGTPLRAKVDLSIKEQDPQYQYLEAGAGARDNAAARTPGESSAAQPGGGGEAAGGGGASDRSAAALDGESAPEFAARMGLDPSAWRGLDVDLSAGLSLAAGVEVGFSAGLGMSAGIGFSAGFQAGADLSMEASLGLEAKAGVSANVAANLSAEASAGFALSAAGGVGAAIESAKIVKGQSASMAAKEAFTPPGGVSMAASTVASGASGTIASENTGGSAKSLLNAARQSAVVPSEPSESSLLKSLRHSDEERAPMWKSGKKTHSERMAARSSPPSPGVDKRAVGFGYGAPLKPQIRTTRDSDRPKICRPDSLAATQGVAGPEFTRDPAVFPWVKLPARDESRQMADDAETSKQAHPCHVLYTNKRKTGG